MQTQAKFFKYPSLTNDYAIGKVKAITGQLDEPWYSTEKIHGANASILMDKDGNWELAKRSGVLNFDGNSGDKMFNGLESCISPVMIYRLKDILHDANIVEDVESDYLIAYGEYFGDGVQAMDYEVVKNHEKDFRIFNVLIHQKVGGKFLVLTLGTLRSYFPESFCVPFNKLGTLRKLLQSELTEESALGGYKEGEVYQPIQPYFISDNGESKFLGVKRKTKRFLETKDIKKVKTSKNTYSINEINIQNGLGDYITKNRLNNVLSHGEHELIPQNIGNIMKAMKDDAISDFKKDIDLEKLIKCYDRDIAVMIKEKIKEKSEGALNNV